MSFASTKMWHNEQIFINY